MDNNFATEEAFCCKDQEKLYEKHLKSAYNTIDVDKNKSLNKSLSKAPVYWELANGKLIDIDTMTIEHLRNVLKLVISRGLLKDK